MADFGLWIPAAFPALAIAHFVALLSPGQDFFLITAHAVRHGLRGSRFICLGVALGNAIYIAIAILGWQGIRDHTLLFSLIEVAGAAYLLWVGSQLLRSQPHSDLPTATVEGLPNAYKQLLLGISSALLNPKNALFYMSLMVTILGNDTTLPQQVFCGLWMFLVVLFWDLFVAAMIGQNRVRQKLQQKLHWIERGAGVTLMGLGIGMMAQGGFRT